MAPAVANLANKNSFTTKVLRAEQDSTGRGRKLAREAPTHISFTTAKVNTLVTREITLTT